MNQNIDLDNGSIITISARGRATAPATITDLELNGTSLNDQLAGTGDLQAFNEFITLSLSNFDPSEGWTLRGFVDVEGGNGQAPRMQIEVSTNPIDVQLGAGSNTLLVYGRPLTTDTVTLRGDVIVQSTLNLVEQTGTSGTGLVSIQPGALVQGVGTVAGLLVEGTLEPGNNIGTLTAGDVTTRGGSLLRFEIDAAGSSDTLVVTNSVEIDAGTTFDVIGFDDLGSLAIQTTETLIDNQGGQPIGGTFVPDPGRLGDDGLFFSLLSLTGGDGNDLTAEAFRTELTLQDGQTNSEQVIFPDGFPGFTFMVDGLDSATFTGSFSESGTPVSVSKDGSGTLALTDDQFYTGDTNLLAGTLVNDAALLASTVVVDGGVYTGSGSSAGLIVNGGGAVAPGNGIGTLTVTGDAAFNAGSTFEVNLSPEGQSDLLLIGGTATISDTGTAIRIVELPGVFPEVAPNFVVLEAAGGVTGEFAEVQDNLPDIDFLAIYTGTEVQLTYSAPQPGPPDSNPLDPGGFDEFSPKQIHPSALAAGMYQSELFAETLRRRGGLVSGQLDRGQSGNALLGFVEQAEQPDPSVAAAGAPVGTGFATLQDGLAFWGGALGQDITVDGANGLPGWDATTAGLAIGIEREFADWSVPTLAGLALGFSQSWVNSGTSSADIETIHLGAYAATTTGPLTVSGAIAYAWQNYDFDRVIPFLGGPVTAKGDSDGYTLAGSFEAFYDLATQVDVTPGLRFGPLATVTALSGELEGFTESQAGILDLTVLGTNSDQVVSGLGLWFGLDRAFGSTEMALEGRLAWERTFGNRSNTTLSAIPIAGATFATPSALVARDRLALGLGAVFTIGDSATAELRYDGSFASSESDHAGSAGVTIRF